MIGFKDIRSDYQQVPSAESLSTDGKSLLRENGPFLCAERKTFRWKYALATMLFSAVFTLIGFGIGRYSHPRQRDSIQVGTELRSFVYNRKFADPPSNETNSAWGTIFPPHAGFFHDNEIAPHGASLAAYHQLHCVDGIRHAYWILHAANERGEKVDFDALPDHHTPWHTRHCIDFLRQMLMCNADLTVEYVDPKLHGVVGFGVDHRCVRWDEVMQWTIEKQRKWAREQGTPTT